MNIIIESIYVGLFVLSIGIIVIKFVNGIIGYYIIGFLKHFLGYYLGIQDYYCNYGNKCVEVNKDRGKLKASNKKLLIESLLEGIVFMIMGIIIEIVVKNEYIILFLIGFIIHMISEWIGIHLYFCDYNCK